MKTKAKSAKHWRCRCGATYHSPRPVKAVMCVTCTNRAGVKVEKWMEVDDV